MKLVHKVGNTSIEFEAGDVKQAVEKLSQVQEVFYHAKCEVCDGDNLRFEVREHEGNKYYSLKCLDCGAQLDFGQYRDGSGLFAKRGGKNEQGEWKPIGKKGWYKWQDRQGGQHSSSDSAYSQSEKRAPAPAQEAENPATIPF